VEVHIADRERREMSMIGDVPEIVAVFEPMAET
jgi:hypothetical protein